VWTVVEPLLRMENDWRTAQTLGQLSEVAGSGSEQAPAAAMLERNRVANLLRAHLASGMA
jgi:hypothetical protein